MFLLFSADPERQSSSDKIANEVALPDRRATPSQGFPLQQEVQVTDRVLFVQVCCNFVALVFWQTAAMKIKRWENELLWCFVRDAPPRCANSGRGRVIGFQVDFLLLLLTFSVLEKSSMRWS